MYGHLVVAGLFLHEDISVALWHHYNCCPPYLRCSIVVSLMVAVRNSVLLFWMIYVALNLSLHYPISLIMILSHHNTHFMTNSLHWHLSMLLKSPTSLMGFKSYKTVSYWEPHNVLSWKGIKPSENLTNVVTIDLCCCLNNCMLCYLTEMVKGTENCIDC